MSRGYHSRWVIPEEHRVSPGYIEAGAKIALGQAVYDRRTELGLSQTDVARRAGMTQPAVSRVEGGAVTLTLPLLRRLAVALDATLDLRLESEETRVSFIPRDDAA